MEQLPSTTTHDLIYLDSNGTTPTDAKVQQTISHALQNCWGNVSSDSVYGRKAQACVEEARRQVAVMINVTPKEILFTSGGTEANNTLLNTFARSWKYPAGLAEGDKALALPHIISSSIEHDSVRKPLDRLQAGGLAEVTFVDVDKRSHAVSLDGIMNAIRPSTVLISLMLANNETGVIQPVKEISVAIKQLNKSSNRKIYIHTDAAQAIGKIPVSVKDLDVDYLTIAGHKFYGPRIGALYVRELGDAHVGAPLKAMILGGGQERGLRAGTENTAMIAGLGKACELVSNSIDAYYSHFLSVRDHLEQKLNEKFDSNVHFNGKSVTSDRLPNTCNFSIIGTKFNGKEVLKHCKLVVAGVGAACHSSNGTVGSAVLLASGITPEMAANAIRLSVGRETTLSQVDLAVTDIWNAAQLVFKLPDQ